MNVYIYIYMKSHTIVLVYPYEMGYHPLRMNISHIPISSTWYNVVPRPTYKLDYKP